MELPCMDVITPDYDERLWDELSHEQSREMQQHQFRVASATRRSHTVASLKNLARQTADVITSVASAAAAKASNLTSSYYHAVPANEDDKNLHEFGLSTYAERGNEQERRDPLLGDPHYGYQQPQHQQQQQQQSSSPDASSNNFVFLRNFRLLPKRDGWGAVANLDLFFASLYNYYYHGGLYPLLGKGVVELTSLFFTLWLSVFLFAYLDWKALAQCTDETTCHDDFHSYIIDKPFRKASLWNLIVILYCLLFVCYGMFAVWSFLHTVRDAWESKHFFEEKLGISAQKLEGGAVEWDRDVVAKLMELQQTGEYRIAISGQGNLDALVVAQRILRKENFMVAFFNCPMLDLSVPFMRGTFFCKSLEWSLYFCVLNYMFNHKYQIRPAFYLDPPSLRRRFIICGIAHAVFMPFLLFFMTLHFTMQNVYDWKSTKKYFGPREWSLSAKWTMREFNELPHFFERRLGPSYEAAENYLKLFTKSPIMTSLGRILVFICGSLCGVLVVLAAINDAIALHVKLGDRNLVWYFGILGIIFSAGKSMLPDPAVHPKYTRNLFAEMDAALAQVTTHTHHYPDMWKRRGWKQRTYKEFSAMFKYKAHLFVMEVVSVIMAPFVLCISLPKCAEHICEFVLTTKTEVPGAGDVCGFCTFDFDSFQDENWEGRTMGTAPEEAAGVRPEPLTGSVMASAYLSQSVEAARALHPTPKTRQGKMEKSFFSFKAAHPSWTCSQSGQELVDQVTQYQHDATLALARERQFHIEAAARQLETLSLLEKRRLAESTQSAPAPNGVRQVDESYIAQMSNIPDAGGGADSGGGGSAQMAPPENMSPASVPVPPGPSHSVPPAAAGATSRVHFDDLQMPTRSGAATPPPFASSEQAVGAIPVSTNSTAMPNRAVAAHASSPGVNPAAAASVLHYADVGLSTELQRILNRSTLEADISAAGSVIGGGYDPAGAINGPLASVLTNRSEDADRATERQYLWLERYHSYLAEQQRSQQNRTVTEARPNLNASDGILSRGDTSRQGGNIDGTGAMSSMV